VGAEDFELLLGTGGDAYLKQLGYFGEAWWFGLAVRKYFIDAHRRGAADRIQNAANLGIPLCVDGTEQTHGSILSRLREEVNHAANEIAPLHTKSFVLFDLHGQRNPRRSSGAGACFNYVQGWRIFWVERGG
jgi:hypothetical protein